MLVPLVLPFQIAALIVLVVGSVIVVVFWRRGNRLHEVLALTAFIGLATMLPLTLAVSSILDPMRYRIFQFATAAEITDRYVQVPPTAVNITYDRQSTGHFARFTVTEPELEAWLQELRDQGFPFDDASNNDGQLLSKEIFQDYFGKYGWKYQTDFKEFSGPWAERGTGFWLWHSATTNTAVLRAGYW